MDRQQLIHKAQAQARALLDLATRGPVKLLLIIGGGIVAASAPKGGLVTYWDISSLRYLGVSDLNDGCGLAPTHHQANFLLTSGEGWLATADSSGAMECQASSFQWDNHAFLVR